MADLWGSVIGAVGSIGSSLIGANAASKAAGAQSDAADRALDLYREMYLQNREDLEPWRSAGKEGLNRLTAFMTDPAAFRGSPGYQFRMDQGVKAIDRGAAARGMLGSGARGQALMRYGQDYASSEYGQEFNRLAALAGIGQTATSQGIASGNAYATGGGQAIQAGGAARASGYVGQANALNNGINNLLYLYGRG